jgi:hypothetical protein
VKPPSTNAIAIPKTILPLRVKWVAITASLCFLDGSVVFLVIKPIGDYEAFGNVVITVATSPAS